MIIVALGLLSLYSFPTTIQFFVKCIWLSNVLMFCFMLHLWYFIQFKDLTFCQISARYRLAACLKTFSNGVLEAYSHINGIDVKREDRTDGEELKHADIYDNEGAHHKEHQQTTSAK
ncbi:hypothetical protein EGR_09120 [Echinococcus granulosus]|uniref:Uncharacterized protein n=1 Tax=Echinococcus granulosus TaxID=6210 RepID=W6U4J0_ECHGR|nr:hypothetical protein EGR_09120 [Echinococcus granulosus]EUB56040.1 hypothetical protein EGR_09120 [Echinococcus granulosus]